MISRLNWRIIELIFKRTFRVFIAIPGVIGLLLVLNTQTGFAQSNMQGDGGRLVDGGQLFEELEQSEIFLEDLENSLEYPGVPPRRIIQTSGDSLPPIRIMPLGDSITKGTGTCQEGDPPDPPNELYLNCTGYRDFLWYSLVDNGYTVDFVGSQGSQFQDDYLNPYHDNDHEGHGGWKAYEIKNNVYGSGLNWLQNYPADIILLHIGTNDIGGITPPDVDQKISKIANDVNQILDNIDQYELDKNKEVLVVLARIINRIDPDGDEELYTTLFNMELQSKADSRNGDNILVVDMEAALIYPDDLGDELHPNITGYSKIANVWFAALEQVINMPPTIANPGDQFSIQGQQISLRIQATDQDYDDLEFSATGLPPGLSIDLTTGEIHGTIVNSVLSGSEYLATVIADDRSGFPNTDPYNKDQVTFTWKINYKVVLPFIIKR
jgi:hypothetical protein